MLNVRWTLLWSPAWPGLRITPWNILHKINQFSNHQQPLCLYSSAVYFSKDLHICFLHTSCAHKHNAQPPGLKHTPSGATKNTPTGSTTAKATAQPNPLSYALTEPVAQARRRCVAFGSVGTTTAGHVLCLLLCLVQQRVWVCARVLLYSVFIRAARPPKICMNYEHVCTFIMRNFPRVLMSYYLI